MSKANVKTLFNTDGLVGFVLRVTTKATTSYVEFADRTSAEQHAAYVVASDRSAVCDLMTPPQRLTRFEDNSVDWDVLARDLDEVIAYVKNGKSVAELEFNSAEAKEEFSRVLRQKRSKERILHSLFKD
jgi:hypothetical protein